MKNKLNNTIPLLHGLLNYKLQFTSFFSIMQRISGFALLIYIVIKFFEEVLIKNYFILLNFSLFKVFFLLFFIYLASYHFLNGVRIYYMAGYYFNVFSNKIIGINKDIIIYVLSLTKTNNIGFFKNFIINYVKFVEKIKNYLIKSKLLNLTLIYIFYLIILFFIVI